MEKNNHVPDTQQRKKKMYRNPAFKFEKVTSSSLAQRGNNCLAPERLRRHAKGAKPPSD